MAHFHPLSWEIVLPCKSSDLDSDPVAQATFVHEYIHYIQCLTGTIGRHILLEMARVAVFAGIQKHHGWPPPSGFGQIHLLDVLRNASRSDFAGTDPATQFQEFERELLFALADKATSEPTITTPQLLRRTLTVGSFSVDDFVHVSADTPSGFVVVPVSDRVVFENMARQVQRNFLRFNNSLDTSSIDGERKMPHGDAVYVCLHDLLKTALPASEDCGKWTIALCQIALLCRNPGTAFERMFTRLSGAAAPDLSRFVADMNRDPWFAGEFNEPEIQGTLNELVGKWGTAMLPRENWELREFTKIIANAHNALSPPYDKFASPLLTWSEVGHWIAAFGCPPVACADGHPSHVQGIAVSMPFQEYLRRTHELLKA